MYENDSKNIAWPTYEAEETNNYNRLLDNGLGEEDVMKIINLLRDIKDLQGRVDFINNII